MGFMNWLMKGVGFEEEQVYDDSIEKEKKREAKLKKKEEDRRKKEEYRARLAQEKADKAAKKYALRQEKDIDVKPQSTVSYVDNPDQYNTIGSGLYSSPIRQSSYGMSSNVGGYGTKNVEFLYPTSFDDAQVVINYLKEGESVVLNLNNMNEYDSQRLLDCASGAIYALNGMIQRVDNNIFLLTPEGFNIKMPEKKQNPQM